MGAGVYLNYFEGIAGIALKVVAIRRRRRLKMCTGLSLPGTIQHHMASDVRRGARISSRTAKARRCTYRSTRDWGPVLAREGEMDHTPCPETKLHSQIHLGDFHKLLASGAGTVGT